VVSATLVGSLLIGVSAAAFGLQPWHRFFEEGVRHSGVLGTETPVPRFVTVFGAAYTAGAGVELALGLHAIATTFAAYATWRLWTRSPVFSVRTLALGAATVLIPPYALDYDLAVLVLPWLLMIRESLANAAVSRASFWPWISVTCLVPVSYLVALYSGQSISGPCLLSILGWTWLREERRRGV
jgi:hypothetical protein